MADPVFTVVDARLDSNTVSKIFGKTPLTIINWRAKKGFPHIRILRSNSDKFNVRYDIVPILEWAAENRQMIDVSMIPKDLFDRIPQELLEHFLGGLADRADLVRRLTSDEVPVGRVRLTDEAECN